MNPVAGVHGPTTRPRSQIRVGGGSANYFVGIAVSLILLAATVAGVYTLGTSPRTDAFVLVILWFNLLLMVGALGAEVSRRPYSLHMLHLLALFLFLGPSAIFQYSVGQFAVAGPIELYREEMPLAALAVSLWLFGYLTAYRVFEGISSSTNGPMQRFLSREVTRARALWTLGFAILVLVYLGVVVGLSGASSRGAAYEASTDFAVDTGAFLGGGLVFHLINHLLLRAFPFVAIVATVLVLRRAPLYRNLPLIALLAAALVGVYVADNPFAAQRIWLVVCLFSLAAPMLFIRLRSGWPVVVSAVIGLTILPALSANRNSESFSDWLDWAQTIGLASPLDFLAKGTDTDLMGMLVMCVKWTQVEGYQWGLQTLSGLLAWFPRSLWRGKGIGTGAMVTEDLGFEFTNLAPPIVAEPVVDFGLAGVFPFAFFLGWLFSKLDRLYWSKNHDPKSPVRVIDVILPFWLGLTILLTRGDLLAATVFILAFTFWVFVLGVGGRVPLKERG